MTEEPRIIPPEPSGPLPGAYDWLVGGTRAHTVEVPIETNGTIRVLRVDLTARARVSPNRPWGYIILIWGMLMLGLLLGLVLKPANAQSQQWRTWRNGPNTYTTGPETMSRSWRDGPNVYTETQHRDGTKERCRSWREGPNAYTRCQ